MPRCEDGRAFLDGASADYGAWPVDPDALIDILDELSVPGGFDPANNRPRPTARQRRALDCLWPMLFVIDPEAMEQDRRRILTYLGRYGRQSMRWEDWWDVDLEEFLEAFHDLSEVIKAESAHGRQAEDHEG